MKLNLKKESDHYQSKLREKELEITDLKAKEQSLWDLLDNEKKL